MDWTDFLAYPMPRYPMARKGHKKLPPKNAKRLRRTARKRERQARKAGRR